MSAALERETLIEILRAIVTMKRSNNLVIAQLQRYCAHKSFEQSLAMNNRQLDNFAQVFQSIAGDTRPLKGSDFVDDGTDTAAAKAVLADLLKKGPK